ncbi:MAG: hypothetical protein ACJA01_002152 [Saprospiraceae bacterium]|jgi:hypothetical protein
MQLTIYSIVFFIFILCQEVKAQVEKTLGSNNPESESQDQTEIQFGTYEKPDWKVIDINFLNSYYAQDGTHGAVTGGIGTEQLTDFTQKITLSIPTSPKLSFNMDAGYDYYSSASTDNIDNIRSSDSASDMRVHGNIGMSYKSSPQHTFGFRIGGSGEYDYTSINGGLTYDWLSKDQNTAIGIGAQAFLDQWEIIYPRELRGQGSLVPTDKRQSYNGMISLSQVVTKKLQIGIQLEATYMKGLLSTPFHRVYFQEQDQAKVEQLPESRMKIPIGVRANAHLTDWLISRMYYRYYWDDWGVKSHTVSVELPIKINRFISVYPSYRYHTQTASEHFRAYKEHTLDQSFYSSDYDLSRLNSHAIGVGLSISPAAGIAKMKVPFIKRTSIIINSIDLKYSHYMRSTDLTANIVSLGVNVSIR